MYVSFQKITLLQNSRGLKRKNQQQQQKQTNKQIINNKNKELKSIRSYNCTNVEE
jgi:hypothetical protein